MNRRVLVADDEPLVRNLIQVMLRRMGFDVLAAEDGAQAYRFFQEQEGDFDALVLDHSMPGMTGEDVVRAVRAGGSTVPVLVVTGFTPAEVHERLSHVPGVAVLSKPFRQSALSEALERLLDARESNA